MCNLCYTVVALRVQNVQSLETSILTAEISVKSIVRFDGNGLRYLSNSIAYHCIYRLSTFDISCVMITFIIQICSYTYFVIIVNETSVENDKTDCGPYQLVITLWVITKP